MLQGKVWGTTKLIQKTPLLEVHRLTIRPNMKCSLHRHSVKANDFFVIEGRLDIVVQKNDYALEDVTVLGPNDYTSVPPGEFHFFRSGPFGCECLEIYHLIPWTGADIERRGVGGSVEA